MTNAEKLVELMYIKNKIIIENSNIFELLKFKFQHKFGIKEIIPYFTEEDAEEIKSWSEDDCAFVLKDIKHNLRFSFFNLSGTTCPFCIHYSNILETTEMIPQDYYDSLFFGKPVCQLCGYGKRRKAVCGNTKALWQTYKEIFLRTPLDAATYSTIKKLLEVS